MTGIRGVGPLGRPTRFPPRSMDEQRAHVERGADLDIDAARKRDLAQAAGELLASPAFELVIEELRDRAYFDLMQSKPGAEGELIRTNAHFRMHVLTDIQGRLALMVENAKFLPADDTGTD